MASCAAPVHRAGDTKIAVASPLLRRLLPCGRLRLEGAHIAEASLEVLRQLARSLQQRIRYEHVLLQNHPMLLAEFGRELLEEGLTLITRQSKGKALVRQHAEHVTVDRGIRVRGSFAL